MEPCAEDVWWSAIAAATGDLTLSGVLAGLLIAAAAALLVQWYEESAPYTIALFASGVPALAFSTFLFTAIAGVHIPDPTKENKGDITQACSQLWSQWLLAMSLLFIGGAVLVCGLGWALINYGDNLAVRLCQSNVPIKTVEYRRMYFIRLNGWLSGGVITTTIGLLIPANVLYVKTLHQHYFESFGVKWYTVFFVFLVGIFFISRSVYIAASRTRSAQQANRRSCAAYASIGQPRVTNDEVARTTRSKKIAVRAALEIAAIIWAAFSALLAIHMTSTSLAPLPHGWAAPNGTIVSYVVVVYILGRAAYDVISRKVKPVLTEKDDTPTIQEDVPLTNAESVERIRVTYSVGRLAAATRSVVILSILGAFFVVALTQRAFLDHEITQIVISLFLGGLSPAAILTGLSYSIPAAEDAQLPLKRKPVRGLAFVP